MALTLGGTSGIVGAGITTLDASGLSVTGVVTTTALDSSSSQKFTIGGTERARIHSDGKVGINSTAPSNLFTIESTSNNQFAIKSDDSNADIVLADTGGSARVRHTGTTFEIWTGGAAGSYFAQSSARRMQIDSSGNTTLNTGNLVIGTSGKGIDFSATGDASGAASELLDDYEEGTFNITLPENGSGNQTVTNNPAGRYTKIGGFVYIYVYAIFSGSPQNNASGWQLGGLPYSPGTSGFTHHGMGQIQYVETYNYSVWRPLIASNSRIYFHRTDGSNASLLNQDVASIGMSYFLMGASYMSVQ